MKGMKELEVSKILGYIGEERKEPVLSLIDQLSKQGRDRAMLIFPDEDRAYRVLAEICGLSEYTPGMGIASLEIRIGPYEGILAAGCIEDPSALEYVPVSLHKEQNLPLFIVMNYGNA